MALYISPVDGVQHTEDPSTAATLPGKALGAPAPATTATTGYVYIPVMAGVPTGVPTAATGYAPLVLDSTTGQLWAYMNGAWQGVMRTLTANDGNAALTVTQNGTGLALSATAPGGLLSLSGSGITSVSYLTVSSWLRATGLLSSQMGTSGVQVPVVNVASIQYTPVGNTAATLTTLYTYSLPANALDVAGKTVRIKSCGKIAAGAVTPTINLLFGGTTLATDTPATNAAATFYEIEATVIKTGASTQTWSAKLTIGGLAPLVFNGTSAEVDTAAIAIATQGNGALVNAVTGTSQETWYAS